MPKRGKKNNLDLDEFTFKYAQAFGVERPLEKRSFLFLTAFFLVIVLISVSRIAYLSLIKHDYYLSRAESNVNRVIIMPAERGVIRDRYGTPIVRNETALSVYFYPSSSVSNNETEAVIGALPIINMTEKEFLSITSRFTSYADGILLKKDVTKQEAIAIEALNLFSLSVRTDIKRVFDPGFAHIVGYTGLPNKEDITDKKITPSDTVGKTNLEYLFDSELRGVSGRIISYRNTMGEELGRRNFSESVKGNDLKTTIDAELNTLFYDSFIAATEKNGSGPGAVGIIINPQNGEVLSLVSVPSFSSGEIMKAMTDVNLPLLNRAISGLYSPGSTIKPIVAVGVLTEKVMRSDDEVYSSGKMYIPNKYNPNNPTRFVDWKAHGWVNLRSAIARSSNIYFYAAGGGLVQNPDLFKGWGGVVKGLGIERLGKYYSLFGLDTKMEIELSGEKVGVIPTPEAKKKRTGIDWTIGDTYITSIGQGDMIVSPISLISAISAIYNGGLVYAPHLTEKEKIILKDNTDLKEYVAEARGGMRDAVTENYGTAHMLNPLPFDVYGKTGSAQIQNNKKTNAFFIGCADYNSSTGEITEDKNVPKEVCILVLIENAKEGGLNAVPVAYEVLEWYYNNRIKKIDL